MDAEKEESNPFESPLAPVAGVDQRRWWALWSATALLTVIAVGAAFSDSWIGLTFLIPLVGVPSLLRTIYDLGRKQAAGWIIDTGVQLQSFCASIAIASVAIIAGGIAGCTVCFTGAIGLGEISPSAGGDLIGLFMVVGVLIGIGAIMGLFYLMGPSKVTQLERRRALHGGPPNAPKRTNESGPAS
ncbi:hypothetical protein [Blastopirellula marina]|uniref:Uncharacterized protein n=1 Tax=Blastopirellula marina DSM 3645 TaxID=314230 RepID=A3ZQE9_9BACT|nr:hypothetical protein [Blastopirellula marina]EAQ81425.1 hypothetical protein DSM3645_23576 [Blastopirellula marina DSM 3645]